MCPKCQSFSPIGSRFCKACGQTLARECPQCDELVATTATFCAVCGFDLRGYRPPLNLYTEIRAKEEKIAKRIESEINATVLGKWEAASLVTEEITTALKRGLVIPLGMVGDGFQARFSLSLRSEQPLQVQIKVDATPSWLRVSHTSISLGVNQTQNVEILVDASRLSKGEFYLGKVEVVVLGDVTYLVAHYFLLGVKKFLAAGEAKNSLKNNSVFCLERFVLSPAIVTSMQKEAKQALVEGDVVGRAIAYTNEIRFLSNPHLLLEVHPPLSKVDNPIDADKRMRLRPHSYVELYPYTALDQRLDTNAHDEPQSRAQALARRWHQLVLPQLAYESKPRASDG